jgi:hypothetical protein
LSTFIQTGAAVMARRKNASIHAQPKLLSAVRVRGNMQWRREGQLTRLVESN